MAIAYTPPQVTVSEVSSPSVNTSLGNNNTVCVVGPVQGYQVEAQQVNVALGLATFPIVTLTSGEQFAPVSAGQLFVSVTNAINPSVGNAANQGGYAQGPDFTVAVNGTNNVATITPISGGLLASTGGITNFTYNVIPANYYQAGLFTSQAAIEQLYGPAYAVGGIQTPTTAAAAAVIENGAVPLVIQPLFVLTDATNPLSQRLQPSTAQIASVSTWQQTLYALRAVQGINYIVPVIGQSMASFNDSTVLSIEQAVQDYIYYMETQNVPNEYIFGFFGEDSTTNSAAATDAILQSHAQTLAGRYSGAVSQNLVLLAPSSYSRANPSSVTTAPINVGGEYVAAGYAGFAAASAITGPLTRQTISNISSVNSWRDAATKNADAQQGLTVLEQNGQSVQIRHAITLDNNSIENRELSVVRSKFFMMSNVISALNSQVIGRIPADGNATFTVANVVVSVLSQLQAIGALVSFSNVQTRLLANDPTTVEIRFGWQPAFPINTINVIFSLDLTGATGSSGSTTTF